MPSVVCLPVHTGRLLTREGTQGEGTIFSSTRARAHQWTAGGHLLPRHVCKCGCNDIIAFGNRTREEEGRRAQNAIRTGHTGECKGYGTRRRRGETRSPPRPPEEGRSQIGKDGRGAVRSVLVKWEGSWDVGPAASMQSSQHVRRCSERNLCLPTHPSET